ncbi:hypothetical protein LTS08_007772 [Lithohypha guttulata]|nr:hypothetical protein LTS08_007772 [Lithohypha guttulata]
MSSYQESTIRRSDDKSNSYGDIYVYGNACPILGNVASSGNNRLRPGGDVNWNATLRALYFDSMNTRKAQIDARATSPEYVQWVYRTEFSVWLCGDESFFWITGRAGSGKSTLMKHVADSRKTKQLLQQTGDQWAVVHFFFDFRAGAAIGNSLEGMLRSMLYQLLKQCSDFIGDQLSPGGLLSLDLPSCLDYICELTDKASCRICAFIDGMDEFEGSGAGLVETIHKLEDRAGFKICLASRPYDIFINSFSKYASLSVQDYNDESIRLYTQAQFQSNRLGARTGLPKALSEKIRGKAQGVFLWARLAVDELLQDLLRGKSIAALEAQLDQMPKEVEEMYQLRELYIAVDAFSRRQVTTEEFQILPINLDDESELENRIFSILGDFVDLSAGDETLIDDLKQDHNEVNLELIPFVAIEKEQLVIRRGEVCVASLTHETLKSYLTENPWLEDQVPTFLATPEPSNLWVNIYLDEMEHALFNRFDNNNNKDNDGDMLSVQSFATRMCHLATYSNDESVDDLADNLLDLLSCWSPWTPLLLLSVQNLLSEARNFAFLDTVVLRRLGAMMETNLMQFHQAICYHRSYIDAKRRKTQTHLFPYENRCAYSLEMQLHEYVDRIGWDGVVSISHGMPQVLLHNDLFDERRTGNELRIQATFDQVWKKYLYNSSDRNYFPLLQRLLSSGALFGGSHMCLFFRLGKNVEESFFNMIISSHASARLLCHADDCGTEEHKRLGTTFLQHWVAFDDRSQQNDILASALRFLLSHGEKTEDRLEGEPLLNSILACDEEWRIGNRVQKFMIALEAGADPRQSGKDGNALQAVHNLFATLNKPHGTKASRVRTNFWALKVELSKAERMVQTYLAPESLARSQHGPDGHCASTHTILS